MLKFASLQNNVQKLVANDNFIGKQQTKNTEYHDNRYILHIYQVLILS